LLTACGDQNDTNLTASKSSNPAVSVSTNAANKVEQGSNLLNNLALTYPNGQLVANKTTQAAQELAQNPAVLKLTVETSQATQATQATAPAFQGQALTADYKPVTRIQNTTLTGAYFFTIYDTELATALANNPNWNLEGPAFWASLAADATLNPVHRFRNILNGSYLYTIYDAEKTDIITNYSNTFAYEGVAWYAKHTAGTGWSPLYRFRNLLNGTYLFSAFEAEKDAIVANYSAVFQLEGVAYYVRQDTQVVTPACTAAPIASIGYSLVFKACDANNVAQYYDKTECVRDNVTGLIWQGQTPAGTGLRANDQYKTNFDSTSEPQKAAWPTRTAPTQADVDIVTNSIGFKNAVNQSNLCGSSVWRLPTTSELLGLNSMGTPKRIDRTWFPNTPQYAWYWSSNPYVGLFYAYFAEYVTVGYAYEKSHEYRDGTNGSGVLSVSELLVRLVH
jgi:Protein of unknown function (DUF1566)/Repeat of unknown function (DUF5648)